MLKIIGNTGCARCEMIKRTLTDKNIDFEYKLFDELTKTQQQELIKMASDSGNMIFPLILKDKVLVNLREVM